MNGIFIDSYCHAKESVARNPLEHKNEHNVLLQTQTSAMSNSLSNIIQLPKLLSFPGVRLIWIAIRNASKAHAN